MGNSSSTVLHKDIFKNELRKMNDIVTKLVAKDNKSFNLVQYNIAKREICESYNMVLSSQLKKHLKVELTELKDAIYIVPNNEKLALQETYFSKQELCDMIAKHYNRILNILVCIKYVYDLEHNGDNSIAGITLQNIRTNGSVFEIRYCDASQQIFAPEHKSDRLDFTALSGFKFYSDNLLNQIEKNIFMRNMRNLLAKKDLAVMAQHMSCGDDLMPKNDYMDVLQHSNKAKNVKCNQATQKMLKEFAATKKENELMFVAKNNPLFHESTCLDKRQLLVDISVKTRQVNDLLKMYVNMKRSYTRNINEINELLKELVHIDGVKYSLKDVDALTVDRIEKRAKQLIAKFYFQSLINFYNLLDHAKTLKPTIVDWKDRLKNATGPQILD